MTEKLTIRALCDLGLISESDVKAAVDAYMADPMAPPFVFAAGYRLNLAGRSAATPAPATSSPAAAPARS